MAESKQLLLTQKQAAVLLDIPLRSVVTLISNLTLKTTMVGGRRLIPTGEVERYIASTRPRIPDLVPAIAECGEAAGALMASSVLENSIKINAASTEPESPTESVFLSMRQLGMRWRCTPHAARSRLVAEHLVGIDMTLPGGQQTMLVAKSVVHEFESRRTRSFSSLCNVQVKEDPAQSRKSKTYLTKKSEDLPDRLLFPQKEVAIKLGVSMRTVGTLLATGLLKSTLIGGRRLVSLIDLQKFARSDHPDIGTRGPR